MTAAGGRIAIVGAGAIGGTLAAALAAAGLRPTLVARGARRAMLRSRGLIFRNEQGDEAVHHLPCPDVAELSVHDTVFLAVKADALPLALAGAMPLIGPRTTVVPLVNGLPWWYFAGTGGGRPIRAVDPAGALFAAVPARQIVGSVVFVTAEVDAAGVVCGRGMRRLVLGAIEGDRDGGATMLAVLLDRAGLATTVTRAIRDMVWSKVALNLATNPLSVVTLSTLADQFSRPDLLDLVTRVLAETRAVSAALGASMSMTLDEMIAYGRRAGAFETSMLQDYRRGRALELGAIADSVFEVAADAGVAMPVARRIVDLARAMAGRRTPGAPPAPDEREQIHVGAVPVARTAPW